VEFCDSEKPGTQDSPSPSGLLDMLVGQKGALGEGFCMGVVLSVAVVRWQRKRTGWSGCTASGGATKDSPPPFTTQFTPRPSFKDMKQASGPVSGNKAQSHKPHGHVGHARPGSALRDARSTGAGPIVSCCRMDHS
jgi:hypothetical protein